MPPDDTLREDLELSLGGKPPDDMTEAQYQQFLIDMRTTFMTPHGQRIFWWLLERGHYFDPVFTPKNPFLTKNVVERDFVMTFLVYPLADADAGLLASILTQGLVDSTRAKEE